ncbi:transporter substrate-binding domain-containing protein [Pigmentibacter sp. JX0631]|uniref:substrate-binding periplasmic protein n=1 Tax=Pigmentibacter sp. JX0631 TaxID=2976982 RepID=UPI0024683D42|nr:transporter substrate-binding domain-containing protein [Pigmentibacter sp. JX0631]WGL59279.1 transporter substrate-binding domain-containing protein [Pigmentibacter sp. JX0631]
MTGEYPPFSSQAIPDEGIAVEIVKKICKEANLNCSIQFLPWLRCEYLVESGKAFAAFPYAISDERRKKYFFSEPIFYADSHIFFTSSKIKLVDSISLNEIKKLNLTIGILRGNFYAENFKILGIKFEESSDYSSLLKKLLNNRIDAIIEGNIVLRYEIKSQKLPNSKDIKSIQISEFKNTSNILIVAKKYANSQKILEKINLAIKKLKINGTIERIIKKYN